MHEVELLRVDRLLRLEGEGHEGVGVDGGGSVVRGRSDVGVDTAQLLVVVVRFKLLVMVV